MADSCGVTISSIFTSLLEPAYKATITDLLTPKQYSKANGLVQVAGSAKYLISPILAGFLLGFRYKVAHYHRHMYLFVTVSTTLVVRKGFKTRKRESTKSFTAELREGFTVLKDKRGVFTL